MTSFVSWRSIVVHRFLVECTKWVSPRIHIEVFSRVKANFRLSVNFVANVRHLQYIIPQIRNEGFVFIEIMASFGYLLKKRVTVSNTLKPCTTAPIVRGRTTPTDDDERAYGGPQGSHVQTKDIAWKLNIFHTK